MKWPFLISILLFAHSCRSDEPEASDPPPPTAAEQRARNIEKADLLNEKQDLLDQLDRLISTTDLDPDGQIAALESSTRSAQTRFGEIRNTHPLLVKVNKDIAHWKSLALSSTSAGRTDEAKRANEKIIELQGDLNQMAKTLPEFTALQTKIRENSLKIRDLRKSLASNTPEGQKIVARLDEIDAEIQK